MAGKKISGVFLGWPKPIFSDIVKTNKNFNRNYQTAMMYAHYEMSPSDLKKEVIKYLKSIDVKHPLLDKVKVLHENRLSVIGKYIYILNNGGDLPDKVFPTVMPFLEKVVDEEKETKEIICHDSPESEHNKDNEENIKISIQDRLRDKARSAAGELEGWIDEFVIDKTCEPKSVDEFVGFFKSNDLKAPHMRHIHLIFKRRADEVENALSGDKSLLEGYSNFTKQELKKFDQFFKNMFKATTMLQEVAKVTRAPKKKKAVSHEKMVSKLKYKKEDSSLGIVSLSPIQILGSKEVWIYNTRTRKLAQYKAVDERGLLIKGTCLLNYSSDSVEKTIRKPIETLADFKKASKIKLRTFLKELTTVDVPANGKLNENHVILRIDK